MSTLHYLVCSDCHEHQVLFRDSVGQWLFAGGYENAPAFMGAHSWHVVRVISEDNFEPGVDTKKTAYDWSYPNYALILWRKLKAMDEWASVYKLLPRRTVYLGDDGFFYPRTKRSRGKLMRCRCWHGAVWYFTVEDHLASVGEVKQWSLAKN